MTLPADICRCLGSTCGVQRVGCARFETPADSPWAITVASTLLGADTPPGTPCPSRIVERQERPT